MQTTLETTSHKDGRKSVIVTKKEEIHTSTVVTKTIDDGAHVPHNHVDHTHSNRSNLLDNGVRVSSTRRYLKKEDGTLVEVGPEYGNWLSNYKEIY